MELTDEQLERFWDKVDVTNGSGCWEWNAYKGRQDYGGLTVNSKFWLAHRLSWTIHNGKIPKGLHVCHHCDNPSCVRPSHLFLGTDSDNMRDMIKKGRSNYCCGENNGRSVLTQDEVIAIFYEDGTNVEIGERYGVNYRTISAIKNKKIWTHVTKNL